MACRPGRAAPYESPHRTAWAAAKHRPEEGRDTAEADSVAASTAAPTTTAAANDPLASSDDAGVTTTAFGRISSAVTGRFRKR